MAIQSFSKFNLLLIVLLCFSCDIEELSYNHSQDPESDSFVKAPTESESIEMLSSITDTSIGIHIIISDEKRIMIERNIIISDDSTKNDTTFYVDISIIEGSVIIDTHRVQLEKTYEYKYLIDDKKSIAYITDFIFSDGSSVRAFCVNWSKITEKKRGFDDNFSLDISSIEYLDWLDNEAY